MHYAQLSLKGLLILLFTLTILQFTSAQSTQVLFEVNMNHFIDENQFNPISETIDIAGTFNDWGSNYTELSDNNEDGIYSISISLNVGQTIEYKFRINGDWNGREEFPDGGPNRSYTVEENGVVSVWYNDELPDDALSVQISATNTFLEVGETVQLFDESGGFPVSWEWTFEGAIPNFSDEQNPIISYSEEGSYDVSLSIINEEGESISATFENFITVGKRETFWWNEDVFYEIFVRSYKDSDGDGIGDLRGLINNLDYLNDGDPATHDDLGITGIWLMPIAESPSYHGYDVTDYRTIAQDYGSNDDFIELMEEAHKRGIKIIVDYVMNHSSSQHPWFEASTSPSSDKRDWYIWRDSHPGYNGPWGQAVWHQRNNHYYYGVFWSGMPDLNYETAAVKEEMFDVARFWIEDMKVDGFRLDAIKFLFIDEPQLEDTEETIEFWREFRSYYKSVNENVFAVGEAWTSTQIAQRYVNDGGLDYVFEFDLANAMLNAANNGNVNNLYEQMDRVMSAYPYMQFGTFLTNHDINRVMDQLGRDENKAKFAADLLLSLPGIPYLYYGEEIGMVGSKPDEDIRTPLQWNAQSHAGFTSGTPWRAVKNDYQQKNIATQQRDQNSLWHHYRKLIDLRNNEVAIRKGNYTALQNNANNVYSFVRSHEDEYIIILANAGNASAQNVELSQIHLSLSAGDYQLVDLRSGQQTAVTINELGAFDNFTFDEIPAKSSLILKVMESGQTQRDVLFRLDMNAMIATELFDPQTEQVDMVSNLNAMGDEGVWELDESDTDGIYTINIADMPIGSTIHYKYRINGRNDGSEEFSDSDFLRSYTVRSGDNVVHNIYERNTILQVETELSNQIVIYPNPAQHEFFIESNAENANFNYSVLDLMGREVERSQFSGKKQISTRNWQAGMYLILVKTEGKRATYRVVVRN